MNEETRIMRESLFSEILMMLIISLSIISCLMLVRGFNEFVTITMYEQLLTLILPVIHTLIRRKWPKLLKCFLLHIGSSVLFFLAAGFIPFSPFAANLSNRVYLGIIVFFFTVSSFSYRLNPRINPSDSQVAAIPACIFPIAGIFYAVMNRASILTALIGNTILCAVLYLVMRQIAVFDNKYYHSIRGSSMPPEQLRKQNYKTAAALVGIFVLTLLILKLVPIGFLTRIVLAGLQALIRMLIPVIIAIMDFFAMIFRNAGGDHPEDMVEIKPEEIIGDEPWVRVISIIIAIIILAGLILLVLNSIRLLILNAPKYGNNKESSHDGIITDTIENINPGKRTFFRRRLNFGRGRERRIRKQFYDRTVRAMRKGLPVSASSTPGQIEDVLAQNGDTSFSALRQEYEKVRYGK